MAESLCEAFRRFIGSEPTQVYVQNVDVGVYASFIGHQHLLVHRPGGEETNRSQCQQQTDDEGCGQMAATSPSGFGLLMIWWYLIGTMHD